MFNSFLIAEGPILTNKIAQLINLLFESVGNFGVAVIIFTIILKVALTPLDVWQKLSQRKQSNAMKRIQPQMAKLQKMYADRPDLLRAEQQKLYKSEKISMFGSFLPLIITTVIFFVVFAGFNQLVRYQNEKIVWDLYKVYAANPTVSSDILASQYMSSLETFRFGWIKNVFMPDSWASIIPSFKTYAGSGLGSIAASNSDINIPNYYDTLVGPAIAQTKKSKFFDFPRWNGYLVFPLLSIVLSFVSTKFLSGDQPQPIATDESSAKMQNTSMKLMKYTMPIMMGVFSVFYSSAFSIYIFFSTLYSVVLSLIMLLIFKKIDNKKLKQGI